jgi:hypothetical protein
MLAVELAALASLLASHYALLAVAEPLLPASLSFSSKCVRIFEGRETKIQIEVFRDLEWFFEVNSIHFFFAIVRSVECVIAESKMNGLNLTK